MLSTFGRLLLLFTRPNRRIAKALEDLRDLYELDLNSRGVYRQHPAGKEDQVELMYGPRPTSASDID